MAITIIPKKIQSIWEVWNLRSIVLASLFCQILLISCASWRKRIASYQIHVLIWSAYLLADWVATFAIGLISSIQGEKCEKVTVNDALAAFWAPFLLLHLGGPATITAFSLEDNELWIRHMLGLMVELFLVAYVFSQSIPNDFWLPTVLVFFAGTIKYAERVRALYLACLDNFKVSMRPNPDPGPKYGRLMKEYVSKQAAQVPTYIHKVSAPEKVALAFNVVGVPRGVEMDERQIIKNGYKFFSIFKRLIVDLPFNLYDCKDSRKFFLSLHPHDAFRVMEVELNFLFDELFTKMGEMHKATGYISHFTCTALVVVAFLLFTMHDKHNIHRFDIRGTQALLIGAIILDIIALIRLIFSDWTIAFLGHLNTHHYLKEKAELFVLAIHKRISFCKRWSKSVYQHNLMTYCLKKQSRILDIADFFGFKETLEEKLFTREQKVNEQLIEFIFTELKDKALQAKDTINVKKISSARGNWTLSNLSKNGRSIPLSIMSSVTKNVDYDQSVLTWHIATEICFFSPKNTNVRVEHRELCKHLSDYLIYLLIMRPRMMSSVAGIAKIKFQDTCEEVRNFIFPGWSNSNSMKENEACQKLLEVDPDFEPEGEGFRTNSVLFDACILAKELMKLDDYWEIMSKVWLELLCYGASHCRGDAHAQQLSKGGELVTFVWLLMAHFGFGDHLKIETGHAILKLMVEK